MKMLKTLAAFAFAMGLMFTAGNMSAEAFSNYNHNANDGDFSGCQGSTCHATDTEAGDGPVIGFGPGEACSSCHNSQSTTDGNAMNDNDTTMEVPAFMTVTGTDEDGDGDDQNHSATCGTAGSNSNGCHNATGTEHYATTTTLTNCTSCHGLEPTKADTTTTTNEDTALTGNLNDNITAVAGTTYTFAGTATNGTFSVDATTGAYTYIPNANYSGTDTINFTVTDDDGLVDNGKITVTVTAVNDAPEAGADTATTDVNTAVVIDVLANDSDADNDDLTVALGATAPINGDVTLGTDGKITYTPDADFYGTDTFTYTIADGTTEVEGTVTVTVKAPDTDGDGIANDVDTDDDNDTILDGADQDSTVAAIPVEDADTANALDGAKASGQLEGFDATKTTPVVVDPLHGTLTISETGAWTYTPEAGYEGEDSFTITYFNSVTGEVVEYTVTVTVTAEEEPPFGPDDNDGNDDDGSDDEEDPESTNPNTGGTAGLMLAAAVTTASAAGMVVSRKRK